MSTRVYFHLTIKIHEGKVEAFRKIVDEMTALTKEEPGALGYEWYLSADDTSCRLVETYADQAAVMAHITGTAVRDVLPQLLQVSSITSFGVYGDPGAEAGASLTAAGAEVFQQIAGIVR